MPLVLSSDSLRGKVAVAEYLISLNTSRHAMYSSSLCIMYTAAYMKSSGDSRPKRSLSFSLELFLTVIQLLLLIKLLPDNSSFCSCCPCPLTSICSAPQIPESYSFCVSPSLSSLTACLLPLLAREACQLCDCCAAWTSRAKVPPGFWDSSLGLPCSTSLPSERTSSMSESIMVFIL